VALKAGGLTVTLSPKHTPPNAREQAPQSFNYQIYENKNPESLLQKTGSFPKGHHLWVLLPLKLGGDFECCCSGGPFLLVVVAFVLMLYEQLRKVHVCQSKVHERQALFLYRGFL